MPKSDKGNHMEIGSGKGVTIINQVNVPHHQTTKKPIVQRNYVVALVLSVFLGILGVDRFYVNHIGLGLLKLFTCGMFGIWWIIDIIMFATKNVSYVEWVK
ncbi:MAG: TM2 domain-containing protein [Candidatus Pacearchaeota archaeon]|nr:TM2 domain-containing protein [Candidatus Pacearchaeota archaeon]